MDSAVLTENGGDEGDNLTENRLRCTANYSKSEEGVRPGGLHTNELHLNMKTFPFNFTLITKWEILTGLWMAYNKSLLTL